MKKKSFSNLVSLPFLFRIVLLIMLLPLISHATLGLNNSLWNNAWKEAMLPLSVVLLLNVSFIVLLYMYGSAAHDPKALFFSKSELFQMVFSLMLLFAAIGIVVFFQATGSFFISNVFNALGLSSNSCYSSYSNDLLSLSTCFIDTMQSDAKSLVSYSISQSIHYQMESTYTFSLNFPLFGTRTVPTGAYRKTMSSNYDLLNNLFATPALVSVSMQNLIIKLLLKYSISIVLPFALLLRIFFPTRQAGNLLISLVIAIYVFLPLIYSLNGAMYSLMFKDACSNPVYSSAFDDFVFGKCNDNFSLFHVVRLIPQAVFLPNLAIVILITFASSINRALRVVG